MLGRRIKLYRIMKEMSQQDLEVETGVSKRSISRLEQGQSVQLETLFKILLALDLGENIEALVPASSDIKDIDEDINIREMVRFASDILTDRERISLKATDGWISGESGMMSRSVHCHGDLHAGICNICGLCREQIRMRSLAS